MRTKQAPHHACFHLVRLAHLSSPHSSHMESPRECHHKLKMFLRRFGRFGLGSKTCDEGKHFEGKENSVMVPLAFMVRMHAHRDVRKVEIGRKMSPSLSLQTGVKRRDERELGGL